LLKDFGKNNFPKIHYFNFEEDAKLAPLFDHDLKPKRILDSLSLYQNKSISTKDLIIFDEIQECPAAITSLKYFCESYPEGFFAAAGSLLGLHFHSSFPVAKVSFVDLAPLNFEEFLLAVDESLLQKKLSSEGVNFDVTEPIHSRLWELLKNYFIVGGMPESVSYYVGSMDDPVAA
jgi:hypothetical protein